MSSSLFLDQFNRLNEDDKGEWISDDHQVDKLARFEMLFDGKENRNWLKSKFVLFRQPNFKTLFPYCNDCSFRPKDLLWSCLEGVVIFDSKKEANIARRSMPSSDESIKCIDAYIYMNHFYSQMADRVYEITQSYGWRSRHLS